MDNLAKILLQFSTTVVNMAIDCKGYTWVKLFVTFVLDASIPFFFCRKSIPKKFSYFVIVLALHKFSLQAFNSVILVILSPNKF
jgi:hypothetical protein